MTDPQGCQRVRDLIPEVAMGVAPGELRAEALAHVDGCADCRAFLEENTELVDELMLLVPEHEPPVGFEARVLSRVRDRARWYRRPTTWLAAAAVVLAAVASGVAIRTADSGDRSLAAEYRDTLRVAHGRYLRAATLVSVAGRESGHVFAYEGKPSWVFMTVADAPSGTYRVRLVTRDGRAHDLGDCWVRNGRGSWGTSVGQPIDTLARVEMTGPAGSELTASFRS